MLLKKELLALESIGLQHHLAPKNAQKTSKTGAKLKKAPPQTLKSGFQV